MTEPRFHCGRCGLCCRQIGGIPQLARFDRGDGVCRHLTDGNLCDIYETRPEVCSVERMYARFQAEMGREQYYALMEDACRCLKARAAGGRRDDVERKLRMGFGDFLKSLVGEMARNADRSLRRVERAHGDRMADGQRDQAERFHCLAEQIDKWSDKDDDK